LIAGVGFGGYRFKAETGRLWSGAREIRLTPKASDVLHQLVSHAGELVSKEHLFATVWNGTAVSDDALTSCIQELRRALEDDAKEPRFTCAAVRCRNLSLREATRARARDQSE
jgi:DNA-binding winged helix-turn-helix (wHTH) protein